MTPCRQYDSKRSTVTITSGPSSSSSMSSLQSNCSKHRNVEFHSNYLIASSPFDVEDLYDSSIPPATVNAKLLNTNLGHSRFLNPNHRGVLRVIALFDALLFAWWQRALFKLYTIIPLAWRQLLSWVLWRRFFLPLHSWLLQKSTGIHPSTSYEFHALTTLMYFGRYFPVSIERMRFSLSQLAVIARPLPFVTKNNTKTTSTTASPTTVPPSPGGAIDCRVEGIEFDMKPWLQQQHKKLKQAATAGTNNCYSPYDQDDDELWQNPTIVQGAYVVVLNNSIKNNNTATTPATTPATASSPSPSSASAATTSSSSSPSVILWMFGGAFLAGDVAGNLEHAKHVAMAVGLDVFLPSYRLVPECHMNDQIWDVTLAYRYLIEIKHFESSRIFLWGISSGAGLAVKLIQNASLVQAAEARAMLYNERKENFAKIEAANGPADSKNHNATTTAAPLTESLVPTMVLPLLANFKYCRRQDVAATEHVDVAVCAAGAVLLAPFCDYTEAPPQGSFWEYAKHDLIVNQPVQRVGVPFLEIVLGPSRKRSSPVYGAFGQNVPLPPVCIVVSEHEVVWDQTLALVRLLQQQQQPQIEVTLGVWKYMFHVFQMMYGYLPEGMQAMQFCLDWIVQHVPPTTTAAVDDDADN